MKFISFFFFFCVCVCKLWNHIFVEEGMQESHSAELALRDCGFSIFVWKLLNDVVCLTCICCTFILCWDLWLLEISLQEEGMLEVMTYFCTCCISWWVLTCIVARRRNAGFQPSIAVSTIFVFPSKPYSKVTKML